MNDIELAGYTSIQLANLDLDGRFRKMYAGKEIFLHGAITDVLEDRVLIYTGYYEYHQITIRIEAFYNKNEFDCNSWRKNDSIKLSGILENVIMERLDEGKSYGKHFNMHIFLTLQNIKGGRTDGSYR